MNAHVWPGMDRLVVSHVNFYRPSIEYRIYLRMAPSTVAPWAPLVVISERV